MRIHPGQMLLHYRMVEMIGHGGMGVVWKAVDTTLDREVAIKLLPDEFAQDTMRFARFEREAKVLASLNHPNIATVHSIHEASETRFLAMELVDGEDLSRRLHRGALPVDEAVWIAIQIAEALETAHESGVIHRDLKPANIRLTHAGKVKVLDFGLAKALGTGAASGPPAGSPSLSPTLTSNGTSIGVILGTAAYMSPEQARGEPVDRRTDIWSFGVVLWEALTGRPLFQAATATDSITAVQRQEPDWTALPPATPPLVRLVLHRCLQRDRDRRLRDIGDALIELRAAMDPAADDPLSQPEGSAPPRAFRGVIAGLLLAAAILGVAGGWLLRGSNRVVPDSMMIRFSIEFPSEDLSMESSLSNLALDPSGATLAFVGRDQNGIQIYTRPLGHSGSARALPGAAGGRRPFFSPDGRWVGFIRDGKLMKVPANGGPALTVCAASIVWADPVWLDDGSIVFVSEGGTTLLRVDADGGEPRSLAEAGSVETSFGMQRSITGFDSPVRIPGQPYLVASVFYDVTIEDYDLVAISLDDGTIRPILSNGTEPRLLPPDRLLFSRESSLYAAPFDAGRGVVTGEADLVLDGILTDIWADNAQYAAAANGTLVYVPGRRRGPGRRLVRVDTAGKHEPLLSSPDTIVGGGSVSPDGKSVLLTTLRRKMELWSLDLERGSFTLISGVTPSYAPVWTPDGREVLYQREGLGSVPSMIVRQAADGGSEAKALTGTTSSDSPTSVSPDGRYVAVTRPQVSRSVQGDVFLVRLDQETPPEPLIATSADESGAVFSPGGALLAYVSDESGRNEIYIRRFPETGRRWQVSAEGGYAPRWSRTGDRLFFLNRDAMFMTRIGGREPFVAGPPERLFGLESLATGDIGDVYDLLPDGGFVMIEPADWEKDELRIEVVVHWNGRPPPK